MEEEYVTIEYIENNGLGWVVDVAERNGELSRYKPNYRYQGHIENMLLTNVPAHPVNGGLNEAKRLRLAIVRTGAIPVDKCRKIW